MTSDGRPTRTLRSMKSVSAMKSMCTDTTSFIKTGYKVSDSINVTKVLRQSYCVASRLLNIYLNRKGW